jgi:hypothetical protein
MAVTNLASDQRDHVARMARFSLDAVKVANQTPIIAADPDEMGYVNLRVGMLLYLSHWSWPTHEPYDGRVPLWTRRCQRRWTSQPSLLPV